MTDFERMAELLLPDITKTPEYFENMYPERNLPEGAAVTRIAPSPTGYLIWACFLWRLPTVLPPIALTV